MNEKKKMNAKINSVLHEISSQKQLVLPNF